MLEVWSQPDDVPGWSVVPQYRVTVTLLVSPPSAVTFPFNLAAVAVTVDAALRVIVGVDSGTSLVTLVPVKVARIPESVDVTELSEL